MITSDFIEVGVKGLMFDDRIGEVEPDVIAPVMPYHVDEETSQLQVQVSNYFADSLFASIISVYQPKFDITPDMVPSFFPIQLNTADLKWILPDMYATYGDVPCSIELAVTRVGDFFS